MPIYLIALHIVAQMQARIQLCAFLPCLIDFILQHFRPFRVGLKVELEGLDRLSPVLCPYVHLEPAGPGHVIPWLACVSL